MNCLKSLLYTFCISRKKACILSLTSSVYVIRTLNSWPNRLPAWAAYNSAITSLYYWSLLFTRNLFGFLEFDNRLSLFCPDLLFTLVFILIRSGQLDILIINIYYNCICRRGGHYLQSLFTRPFLIYLRLIMIRWCSF